MLAIWGFVRPLRWCLCDVIARQSVATATVTEAAMWQQHHPISHKLNMFDSCDCPCDCHTDYTNWSQSHWPAKWCDTWDMEEFFKLIESVKIPFFGKRTIKNTEGRDRGMLDAAINWLHICCTVRANHTFAIHGNAEFFRCGMWKSNRGNLWNVTHLIFRSSPRRWPSRLELRCVRPSVRYWVMLQSHGWVRW